MATFWGLVVVGGVLVVVGFVVGLMVGREERAEGPQSAVRKGTPPLCRFCPSPAVARFAVPRGCVCFPDDRVQDLCAQHEARTEPLGPMVLLCEYDGER